MLDFDILKFILEANYQIVAVLLVLGFIIKSVNFIPDKFIPIILILVSAGLLALQADSFSAAEVFNIVTQSVLTAGAATIIYEIPKQLKKPE